MLPGGGWTVAACLVLLVLAAAKAHGRQVRVARERLGVAHVDFRADNGPVVEALWRKDRIRFWTSAFLVGVVLVPLALLGFVLEPWPLWGAVPIALTLAFAAGFVGAGLRAWMGLEGADWASLGWWTLVAAAAALTAWSVA